MAVVGNDRAQSLRRRIALIRSSLEDNALCLEESRARLQLTRLQVRATRSQREAQHHVAYTRLEGKLADMPMVEQAKGIVMAQTGCSPAEALETLRRASHQSGLSFRDEAAATVRRAAAAVRRTAPSAGPRQRSGLAVG